MTRKSHCLSSLLIDCVSELASPVLFLDHYGRNTLRVECLRAPFWDSCCSTLYVSTGKCCQTRRDSSETSVLWSLKLPFITIEILLKCNSFFPRQILTDYACFYKQQAWWLHLTCFREVPGYLSVLHVFLVGFFWGFFLTCSSATFKTDTKHIRTCLLQTIVYTGEFDKCIKFSDYFLGYYYLLFFIKVKIFIKQYATLTFITVSIWHHVL